MELERARPAKKAVPDFQLVVASEPYSDETISPESLPVHRQPEMPHRRAPNEARRLGWSQKALLRAEAASMLRAS